MLRPLCRRVDRRRARKFAEIIRAMLRRLFFAIAGACALAACSPALNWRSVSVPEAGLTLSLPCKPEHATRPVDLGRGPVELAMTGCEADGATFAVSHLLLADPSQAGATLDVWRAAVRGRMQAEPPDGPHARFVPARALDLPQSVRMAARGRAPDGSAVAAEAVWFARLEGTQARLYHAVVYTREPHRTRGEVAAGTFFDALVLQP